MVTTHHVGDVVVTIKVKNFDSTKPIRFERFISVFRRRCFVVYQFKQETQSFRDSLL